MLRERSESWSELTHFCESSGIIGRSPEDGGGAAETSRAVRAWAAKSQAARTGQQRLRSRSLPQASLTPPNSSSERSRRQVRAWVWTGKAGTVLEPGSSGWLGSLTGSESKPAREKGSRNKSSTSTSDVEKVKHARVEGNDCIF